MRSQLFVPLVTFPDANSDAIAANAVTVVAELGGDLNVVAFNAVAPRKASSMIFACRSSCHIRGSEDRSE